MTLDWFFVAALGMFVVVIFFMVLYAHLLLSGADKRLAMANEMVLKLAQSADCLASSVVEIKDMMVHLEKVYTSRNDMLVKNRDEFREAYLKLLNSYEVLQGKYETLQQDMSSRYGSMAEDLFRTVQDLAQKPTIQNNAGK